MPDYIAGIGDSNVREQRAVTFNYQYPGGFSYNVLLSERVVGPLAPAQGDIDAVRASIADATNFGAVSQAVTVRQFVPTHYVYATTGDYGPDTVANLRFQDAANEMFSVSIPAPIASIIVNDVVVSPDAAAPAGTPARLVHGLVSAIEALVNNSTSPAGTYGFVGGNLQIKDVSPGTDEGIGYTSPLLYASSAPTTDSQWTHTASFDLRASIGAGGGVIRILVREAPDDTRLELRLTSGTLELREITTSANIVRASTSYNLPALLGVIVRNNTFTIARNNLPALTYFTDFNDTEITSRLRGSGVSSINYIEVYSL